MLEVTEAQAMDLLEAAWGVIANVSGGNWDEQSPEWHAAARRWRDRYHQVLHDYLSTTRSA